MKFCKLNKKINDCPICIFRLLIWLSFDLYSVIPQCPHTHNVSRTNLISSKYGKVVSIATFLFLVCTAILAASEAYFSKSMEVITILLQVVNLLFVRCTLYFNRQACFIGYSFLLYLIERRKLFGVRTALSNKFTVKVRYTILVHIVISLIYNITRCVGSIYYIPTWKNAFYAFGSLLTHIDSTSIAFCMIHLLNIYWELLKSLYRTVEETFTPPDLPKRHLSFKLKIWQQYYIAIVNNYTATILAPSNIMLVIVEFSFVILMVICGFIYLVLQPQREYSLSILVDSTLFTVLAVYINFLADNVMKSAEHLVSFLNGYPTSKLGRLEAAQVEMFLILVNLHKPKLKASNILTIGAHFSRSMLKNILTYVLLLLQYKVWFQKALKT